MKNNLSESLRLCLVTDLHHADWTTYLQFIEKAVQGGVTMVQYRNKSIRNNSMKTQIVELKQLTDDYSVPLIINDYYELAQELDCDGVHMGQEDLKFCSILKVREQLGPDKIIGVTIDTCDQLFSLNKLMNTESKLNQNSNVYVSPVFYKSKTKHCSTVMGEEGVHQVVCLSKLPVLAIGGIGMHNINTVMQTGVNGVAVVSALHQASSPEQESKNMITCINHYLKLGGI